MKIGYSFSVLQYMHDTMTTEYINIGVVLFMRKAHLRLH